MPDIMGRIFLSDLIPDYYKMYNIFIENVLTDLNCVDSKAFPSAKVLDEGVMTRTSQ